MPYHQAYPPILPNKINPSPPPTGGLNFMLAMINHVGIQPCNNMRSMWNKFWRVRMSRTLWTVDNSEFFNNTVNQIFIYSWRHYNLCQYPCRQRISSPITSFIYTSMSWTTSYASKPLHCKKSWTQNNENFIRCWKLKNYSRTRSSSSYYSQRYFHIAFKFM